MTPPTQQPRRGRTRWLLVAPILGLAVLVTGVWALEAIAPQVDPADRVVEGVPPLDLPEDRTCTRRAEDTVADDLRAEFTPGGRVASTQVVACPSALDGLAVTYVGEVVGELLPRGGGVWAQVNDDAYALVVGPMVGHRERSGFNTGLTVWLPDGLHEQVGEVGRAGHRGDVVLVSGTLVRADPDDGGGITVRADDLDVLARGLEVEVPFHGLQAVVAAVLAVLAVAALMWSRRVRRR